jgi:hypothetical protein
MKEGKLNSSRKMDSEFLACAGILHNEALVTSAVLRDNCSIFSNGIKRLSNLTVVHNVKVNYSRLI